MTKSGTLFSYKDNFRTYKIHIAANYSGFIVKEDPSFKFGETNKTKKFLQNFPYGKVPAFLTHDGNPIFESNAIAFYVADGKLTPKTFYEEALNQQWLQFSENELLPTLCSWIFPYLSLMPHDAQTERKAIEEVKRCLEVVDKHLLLHTYLAGELISLSDIVLASYLVKPFKLLMTPEFRKPYRSLLRWFDTIINQPEVSKVIGKIEFCAKPPTLPVAKQQVSAAPTTKKAAAVENDGDDMEDFMEEKKTKDPFADMPKGTFNLDYFKRVYSNNETTVSLPYLWQHFDFDNFSMWFCEYKYPQELKKDYMSCNLITGMFQRLDKMRKNAFGSVILFGQESSFTISGVWMWKGHELAFLLSPDWQIDYESYEWKKLEPNKNEKDKQLVNEYFSWEGTFGGKHFNQGKIFK